MIKGGIKFYHLAGEIPGGNSGSPIVNSRGEVTGVHVTVTQEGKDMEMALPSAYILGLEPSLPIQPWTQAAAQPAPGNSAARGPNAAVDASLAATLIKVHDFSCSYTLFSERIYSITRYGNLGRLDLYQVQSDLDNDIAQLGWLKTDDPLRQKLIQATGQLLAKEKQALEFDINCASLNKNTPPSKAVPQAEDFGKRASALLNSIPGQVQSLQPDFRQLAQGSPEFLNALPIEMRYFLGVVDRKSKLVLGAYMPAKNPFFIQGLIQYKLGEKLGLHDGDMIISAGGRMFKADDDIEDFKLMIEANPGGALDVVVNRGGKIKTLSMKIPPDVLQKYLRTPLARISRGLGFPPSRIGSIIGIIVNSRVMLFHLADERLENHRARWFFAARVNCSDDGDVVIIFPDLLDDRRRRVPDHTIEADGIDDSVGAAPREVNDLYRVEEQELVRLVGHIRGGELLHLEVPGLLDARDPQRGHAINLPDVDEALYDHGTTEQEVLHSAPRCAFEEAPRDAEVEQVDLEHRGPHF